MTTAKETAAVEGVQDRDAAGLPASRRPWWVWAGPVVLVLTVAVARSRFLFTHRFYERADDAANSILIEQAKHFTLLAGDYSKERFNHPGPAYLYVQALGEWLFKDLLHLVPTAWNAHVLAVLILNSCFVAMTVAVVYGWAGRRGALACLAVVAGFIATQPWILSFDWMEWMYVPTYLAFTVAAASVAAGASRDLWILTLTGWFLIHGHATFLVIVPMMLAAVLAALVVRYRPRALPRVFARPRIWVPVAVISAVFALPIVVNLALHWPGDFGRYFSYSSSKRAGGHPLSAVVKYVAWFWWRGGPLAVLAPVVSYLVAAAAACWLTRGGLRWFLAALLAVNVVSTVGFAGYAAFGIDSLAHYYTGYFYFAAPVITLVVIAVAVVRAVPAPLGATAAAAGAVIAVAALAVAPATAADTVNTEAALPAAVQAVAASAHGKTVVIYLDHNAWPDLTGFLVQAERTGVRACVQDPWWAFMVSKQFICTPAQLAGGAAFRFNSPSAPRGAPILARMNRTEVTVGAKP